MVDNNTPEEPDGKEEGRKEDRSTGEKPGDGTPGLPVTQRLQTEAQAERQKWGEEIRLRRPPL